MEETNAKNSKSLLYKRNLYLDRMAPFFQKPIIKIISGMRRVGKSVLLHQIADKLVAQGLTQDRICFIDMESLEFEHIKTHQDLAREVKKYFGSKKSNKCLFVDEVQEIQDWEKTIVSLAKNSEMDIYLSGSNAHMLSSDLATRLSGRYIEIPVYPLGFDEFLEFRKAQQEDKKKEFLNYLQYGGLPAIHYFPLQESTVYQYLRSIYDTILMKDIVRRFDIRNMPLLESIVRFVGDNLGNFTSSNRIADYLKSQRIRMSVDTVLTYLGYLESARLVHGVSRFDVKGKRHLEFTKKYFWGDIGLRHAVLGFREGELAGVLENIVYLELKRRGYEVSVGKLDQLEIDFIATKEKKKIYVQVAYVLSSPKTVKREFEPLLAIDDNYPKYVVSTDEIFGNDYQGIQRLNIVDFLLGDA